MLKHERGVFVFDVRPEERETYLETARQLASWEKCAVEELCLNGLWIEKLPPELFTIFPNITWLSATSNRLRTLPREISQLKYLNTLALNANQLQTIPSTITQLNQLYSLYTLKNPLPARFQYQIVGSNNTCQHALREMVAYFEVTRRAVVALFGSRLFQRSPILARVPKDVLKMISGFILGSQSDERWETQRVQNKKR